ncbi:hypothetical protein G6011_11315 [Alternaria panax]|uniref:Alpha/beta hydrolase fold-3 domain-containing protein n=1 Tax=Alternaria panax TaxID=48097 RepID=A0AAD4ID71_9PLEO|nr:hypothetical protein G6011_11315 [Alternaria panax]
MAIDSSTWKEYSKKDAELEALLPHLPPLKSFGDYSSAAEMRQAVNEQVGQMIAAGIVSLPDWTGYHKSEIQIPTRDGASVRSLVFRPEGKEPGPMHVYFHGGGWTFGTPEHGEGIAEILVKELGFTVVSVGYRLGPEHVFPTAAHDAIDAVRWCAENADSLGTDPSKGFVLGGTSAGSNLATVSAHQAVDDRLVPKVTGVVLLSAALCHPGAMPEEYKPHISSWEDHKDSLVLDRRAMEVFWHNYKPDPKSPLLSPLIWKSHEGQPPTYLQVMGIDPLRDEALVYENVLRDIGVPTKIDVYAGLSHGGPGFFPMLSAAKKAWVDLKEGAEWILEQDSA